VAMRLVCLEKAAALHELCRRFSAAERALLEINDIDAAAVLPSGMSLLLPSGKAPEKQRLELYVSKHEDSGQPVSGLVHRASISAPESCAMSSRTAGSERHLPVLALMNLDEGGFVSPALAHRLLTDEESGCQLFQKLIVHLFGTVVVRKPACHGQGVVPHPLRAFLACQSRTQVNARGIGHEFPI